MTSKISHKQIPLTTEVKLYVIIYSEHELDSTLWCNASKKLSIGDYMQNGCLPCKDYIVAFFSKNDALTYVKLLISNHNYGFDDYKCFLIPISSIKLSFDKPELLKYAYNFSLNYEIGEYLTPEQTDILKHFPVFIFSYCVPKEIFSTDERYMLNSNFKWVKLDFSVSHDGNVSYSEQTLPNACWSSFSRQLFNCTSFIDSII